MSALAVPAVLAAGYVLGRWRPWSRLGRWADRRTRDDGRWWLNENRLAAALFVATCPRGSLYAWRHRNDPPPPRSPALQFRVPRRRHRGAEVTQQPAYDDSDLCTAEYPGDELHVGQLCDLKAGHDGDHVAVVGLATAFRSRLTWPSAPPTTEGAR
ncbi:hypothetical protein ACIOYT_00635 [Streptomyces halstedii]|uniref:hypothetical protein n=1 Tax=Streptomyces TaxID=1883 RepID=UPI000805E014|nr:MULTISPECIES: hypothetical protein [unclassified Streptomyces]MYR75095.1 hypothetical protein [Streptomyces sp. SID4925]SBU97915.1 hypothetical protein YUMDRAFT_05965 [Streptomyces sp. OspMP-M45]